MSAISSFYEKCQSVITRNNIIVYVSFPTIGVAFLGEFSSGKTALLNALLSSSTPTDEFFAENLARETATATKVRYTKDKSYYETTGRNKSINRKGEFKAPFSTKQFDEDVREINVYLNNPNLSEFAEKDLFFIDLPGTNSGFGDHNAAVNDSIMQNPYDVAIDNSIPDANIILICVPVDSGNISDSLLRKIHSIHTTNPKAFFIGVATKSGLSSDKGERMCALLAQTLEDSLHNKLLTCVRTDAIDSPYTNDLKATLLNRDDKYFILQTHLFAYKSYKDNLVSLLIDKIAILESDVESAQNYIEKALREMKNLQLEHENEMKKLKDRLDGCISPIASAIINVLIDRVDNIKDESDARNIANQKANEEMEKKVVPILKEVGDKYHAVMPITDLSLDTSDTAEMIIGISSIVGMAIGGITALIASSIVLPVIGLIISAIAGIISLFTDSVRSKVSKQLSSKETRNKVESAVRQAIEQIYNNVSKDLSTATQTAIDNMKRSEELNKQKQTKEERIEEIKQINKDISSVNMALITLEDYAKS